MDIRPTGNVYNLFNIKEINCCLRRNWSSINFGRHLAGTRKRTATHANRDRSRTQKSALRFDLRFFASSPNNPMLRLRSYIMGALSFTKTVFDPLRRQVLWQSRARRR
jgi:hypothetical protein